MKKCLNLCQIVFSVSLLMVGSDTAHAYLGPGAGLGMIGSLVALVIVILVILFGLILYPIRRFLKRRTEPDRSDELPYKESNR